MNVFRNLLMLTLILITCSNCSKSDAEVSYDLVGSWRVVYYLEDGTKIPKTDDLTWPDVNNGDVTAIFSEPDENGVGLISGITVSNHYNGSYTIGSNGEIAIGPVATTLINEPEWTRWFMIAGAAFYEVKNARLYIFNTNRENVIVFEPNAE